MIIFAEVLVIFCPMKENTFTKIIKDFPPVYFALPMSTGIITIASYSLGYEQIAQALLVLNTVELVIFSLLFLARIVFFFPGFLERLSSLDKGGSFLAIVAAFSVVGTANMMTKEHSLLASVNWYVALFSWFFILYTFIFAITIRKAKPPFTTSINGSWLLIIVASQSVSILGNTIIEHLGIPVRIGLLITTLMYLLGLMFYLIIIGIIFYRMVFFPFKPIDFQPSYWINMGAAAISTLAGAVLYQALRDFGDFEEFLPIVKAFTILFWTFGTWWIPILIGLEVWKRVTMKVSYSPSYWSMIFPLGMYTVCTWQLANTLHIPLLKNLANTWIFIAWSAWIYMYANMLWGLWKQKRTF